MQGLDLQFEAVGLAEPRLPRLGLGIFISVSGSLSLSRTPPDRAGPHSSSLCRHATIWTAPISGRVQASREASSELERPLVYLHRWARDPHPRRQADQVGPAGSPCWGCTRLHSGGSGSTG